MLTDRRLGSVEPGVLMSAVGVLMAGRSWVDLDSDSLDFNWMHPVVELQKLRPVIPIKIKATSVSLSGFCGQVMGTSFRQSRAH